MDSCRRSQARYALDCGLCMLFRCQRLLWPDVKSDRANAMQMQSALGAAAGNSLDASWVVDFDDLQFFRSIGQGSFGTVYLGRWHETTVAVKVLAQQEAVQVELRGSAGAKDAESGCASCCVCQLMGKHCIATAVSGLAIVDALEGRHCHVPPSALQLTVSWQSGWCAELTSQQTRRRRSCLSCGRRLA